MLAPTCSLNASFLARCGRAERTCFHSEGGVYRYPILRFFLHTGYRIKYIRNTKYIFSLYFISGTSYTQSLPFLYIYIIVLTLSKTSLRCCFFLFFLFRGARGVSRCCDAILSRDEAKRGRALASLREDPGLQQLLPHLCTFIQSKVRPTSIITTVYLLTVECASCVPSYDQRCVLLVWGISVYVLTVESAPCVPSYGQMCVDVLQSNFCVPSFSRWCALWCFDVCLFEVKGASNDALRRSFMRVTGVPPCNLPYARVPSCRRHRVYILHRWTFFGRGCVGVLSHTHVPSCHRQTRSIVHVCHLDTAENCVVLPVTPVYLLTATAVVLRDTAHFLCTFMYTCKSMLPIIPGVPWQQVIINIPSYIWVPWCRRRCLDVVSYVCAFHTANKLRVCFHLPCYYRIIDVVLHPSYHPSVDGNTCSTHVLSYACVVPLFSRWFTMRSAITLCTLYYVIGFRSCHPSSLYKDRYLYAANVFPCVLFQPCVPHLLCRHSVSSPCISTTYHFFLSYTMLCTFSTLISFLGVRS